MFYPVLIPVEICFCCVHSRLSVIASEFKCDGNKYSIINSKLRTIQYACLKVKYNFNRFPLYCQFIKQKTQNLSGNSLLNMFCKRRNFKPELCIRCPYLASQDFCILFMSYKYASRSCVWKMFQNVFLSVTYVSHLFHFIASIFMAC